MKRLSLLAPFLLFALSAAAQPVKIGVIIPLSGDFASSGEALRNGMALGYSKLAPDRQARLQLIYEDDGFTPAKSITAFNKLLATHRPSAVVLFGSAAAKAVGPLAEKNRIPLIAIATDPRVVKDRHYVVNFWTTAETQIKALLEEAGRRNYRKVARIASIHDFTLSLKQVFDDQNRGDILTVLDEEYPSEVRDFKTYIAKIKNERGLDAVLALLMPGQLGLFAKQAREHGVSLPLFGVELFEDLAEVKLSDGALIGQWYVNNDDPDQSFLELYRKTYPHASLYGASNGHDIVLLLSAAMEKGGSPGEINNFLHTLKDFTGALGTYSASGDNRFTLPAAAKVVTPDGFRKIR